MHQTQFPKILAFVEGHMERIFINNNFHYVTVVNVANGIGWSTVALAKQIKSLFRARNFNGDAILVWVDREKRMEGVTEISDLIRAALLEAGAGADKVHIMVADRMSENIILSDEALMRSELSDPEYTYTFEGQNGKHYLTALLKSSGKHYKETSVGVALLKKVRLGSCATTSPTTAALLSTLNLECWWLAARQ